ncbi:alpha-L-fucosidase [Salegentibacter maritimus]|uniref:alpha-L-fucosidase n=1 Tax=Salegentibacter maritimus TaxID=2794347 RepID=UPI0018E470C1|nr:alpha-L-fucosidase [Salegentibacter maritimus]MBI6117854.1 alpha-L-fucosidase [Salegentibacter maritimus]
MKNIKELILIALFSCIIISCQNNVSQPEPYGPVPNIQQMDWQKMEYYMFIHFGPNTFTDKEWGDGKEDPKVFNPTQLDANQWARTAKAAGMKAIIITAKHHDGFALWPSKYSEHTVRESLWKNGKGDVLKDLSEACAKHGLKFGVYLSPWDQNHPDYGTMEYNQVFANMLDEVLGNYGEVFEVWFDGANGEGPNGKRQEYDWDLFYRTVYKNNSQSIIFSDIGPDARWIGNESGFAGKTNWSTLNISGFQPGADAPKQDTLNQGNINGEHWIPGEADVSIRPGWFFSPSTNDDVKSLEHLLKIYYASVGRNSNLLLNVPVNRKGLIHPNDSLRLMELRRVLDETFDDNIALNKKVTAKHQRGNDKVYAPANLLDGDYETYWATSDTVYETSFTVDLSEPTEFNRLVLQEYIPLGQRVKAFNVEVWNGNKFEKIDEQTTIGYKRILVFPTVKSSKVRINISEALSSPILSEFKLFKAPENLENPTVKRNKNGIVKITSDSSATLITFTTDGSLPTIDSRQYKNPFQFLEAGVVKAKAFSKDGLKNSETVSVTFDIAPTNWKVISSNSELENFSAENAIDSDPITYWLTDPKDDFPHNIAIDLGDNILFNGFTYTPTKHKDRKGIIFKYNFYISQDGKNWEKVVSESTFSNIKNNPVKQEVFFDKTYRAKYIKLEGLNSLDEDETMASAGEIGVITK